jgi:muconate cycloisomerase
MNRISRIEAFRVELPVIKRFLFATGSAGAVGATAAHILVKMTDSDGRVGWGEGRPSPGWSYETAESVLSTIERYLGPALLGRPVADRWGLHQTMSEVIGNGPSTGMPVARCALDIAVHDLGARAAGLSLRAFLGGSDERGEVRLSYTLTAHGVGPVRDDVAEGLAAGFHDFNYKLGVTAADELGVAAAIREAAGCAAFVWADANQSLPPARARRIADGLAEAGTDVLEQPLRGDAVHLMPALRRATRIPLAMDESLVSPTDLVRAAGEGAIDYLVVKLPRSGGVWPTAAQLTIAAAAGLGVLVSGLTDSMLAKLAACQVASVGGFDGPAGLNGSQFIDDSALFPDKARVQVGDIVRMGDTPGVGIEPDEAAVRALASASVLVESR